VYSKTGLSHGLPDPVKADLRGIEKERRKEKGKERRKKTPANKFLVTAL